MIERDPKMTDWYTTLFAMPEDCGFTARQQVVIDPSGRFADDARGMAKGNGKYIPSQLPRRD
jgi:hypothetical protein